MNEKELKIEKKFQEIDGKVVKITTIEKEEQVNRAFKGVWIPKKIWIDNTLSWMEKLFLVEIESLDNDNGCFASNAYFSNFFQLSKQRCSQIVNDLIDKKIISVNYFYKGKEIKKRVLKILNRYQEYFIPYQEYAKDNNTINNKDILFNKLNNSVSKETKNNTLKEKFKSSNKKQYPSIVYKIIALFLKENKNASKENNLKENNLKFTDIYIKKYKKEYSNDEEFTNSFKNSLNAFTENRKNLPMETSVWFNCPYDNGGIQSNYEYHRKRDFTPKLKKDKNPKQTEKYKKLFYGSKELDLKQKNEFISNINNIASKYFSIINKEIKYKSKVYVRKDIENGNFKTFMGSFNKFVDLLHIDFLKQIKDSGNLHEGWLYNKKCWNIFVDHVKKEYNIDFYASDKEILRKFI
jgi:hypothetical protein